METAVRFMREEVMKGRAVPRNIPWTNLVRAVARSHLLLALFTVGTTGSVILGYLLVVAPPHIDLYFGLGFILFIALAPPVVFTLRCAYAIRNGVVAEARISSLKYLGRSRSTVSAVEHGTARGILKLGDGLEVPFESDASWARSLKEGAKLLVLFHPARRKVLFELGPAK